MADKDLDPPLLDAIERLVAGKGYAKTAQAATVAFLYLFMMIAGSEEEA